MSENIIRYIVYIPNQDMPVSYNTQLGKESALMYAKLTARAYFGGIIEETVKGEFREVKNYNKYEKLKV